MDPAFGGVSPSAEVRRYGALGTCRSRAISNRESCTYTTTGRCSSPGPRSGGMRNRMRPLMITPQPASSVDQPFNYVSNQSTRGLPMALARTGQAALWMVTSLAL